MTADDTREPATRAPGALRWAKLALLAALIAGATFAAWRFGFFELRDPKRLSAAITRVRNIPAIKPLFVLTYGVIATLGLPASLLTLAGGAIFGLTLGSLLSWTGAMLGAAGAYLLARALGHDALRGVMGKMGVKLEALGERHGFSGIFRLRLLPVVPFSVLSLAAGLARVPFRDFMAGTALGIIPGTIIYTYFADSLVAGVSGAGRRALVRVTIAAVLLIAISFAPALLQRLRGRSSHKE